jgi:hypothetical protein
LRAAELSYLQTAQDFGYPEDAARQWAAAVLSKLRLEVDKQRWTIRMQLKLLYREAIRAGLGAESSDESGEWRNCPARYLFLREKNAIVLHSDRAPGLSGYIPNHASSSSWELVQALSRHLLKVGRSDVSRLIGSHARQLCAEIIWIPDRNAAETHEQLHRSRLAAVLLAAVANWWANKPQAQRGRRLGPLRDSAVMSGVGCCLDWKEARGREPYHHAVTLGLLWAIGRLIQGSGSLAGSALMVLDEEAVFPCVPAAMVLRVDLSYSESLSKITESQSEWAPNSIDEWLPTTNRWPSAQPIKRFKRYIGNLLSSGTGGPRKPSLKIESVPSLSWSGHKSGRSGRSCYASSPASPRGPKKSFRRKQVRREQECPATITPYASRAVLGPSAL